MANRNRIGRPLLALCALCIIAVAADIIVTSWIERLPPRTCIYISNYYFGCRVIVCKCIFLISPKFKSIQSSKSIVFVLIQVRRINFSSVLRYVSFLHIKRIRRLFIVVCIYCINFNACKTTPATRHCKIERVSIRHSPLTNCLHVIHASCGVHLLRLFGRFRGGGGGHGRHRGGRCGGCRVRGRGRFCRWLRRFGRGGLLRLGALFRFRGGGIRHRGGGVLLRQSGILPGGRSLLILQQLYFARCVGQKILLGVYRQGHCHNQASGDKQRCQPARPTCCVFSCSIQSAHPSFALA